MLFCTFCVKRILWILLGLFLYTKSETNIFFFAKASWHVLISFLFYSNLKYFDFDIQVHQYHLNQILPYYHRHCNLKLFLFLGLKLAWLMIDSFWSFFFLYCLQLNHYLLVSLFFHRNYPKLSHYVAVLFLYMDVDSKFNFNSYLKSYLEHLQDDCCNNHLILIDLL